jgi:hypothetical protein
MSLLCKYKKAEYAEGTQASSIIRRQGTRLRRGGGLLLVTGPSDE